MNYIDIYAKEARHGPERPKIRENITGVKKDAARFAACQNAVRARPRSGARGGGLAELHIVDLNRKGQGDKAEELDWFRDAILRETGKRRKRRDE